MAVKLDASQTLQRRERDERLVRRCTCMRSPKWPDDRTAQAYRRSPSARRSSQLRSEQRVQLGPETPTSVIPAVRDHVERRSGQGHFGWRSNSQQRPKVRQILWIGVARTGHLIALKILSRDDVARPPNAWISASASASLATATAKSASRVNRGSVRAETARPPYSANEARTAVRSI